MAQDGEGGCIGQGRSETEHNAIGQEQDVDVSRKHCRQQHAAGHQEATDECGQSQSNFVG